MQHPPYVFVTRTRLSPQLVFDVLEHHDRFDGSPLGVYFWELIQKNDNRYKLLARGSDHPTVELAELEAQQACNAFRIAFA